MDRAKVLSNTIKQKRKEKAGKWEVPLPKVRLGTRPSSMHLLTSPPFSAGALGSCPLYQNRWVWVRWGRVHHFAWLLLPLGIFERKHGLQLAACERAKRSQAQRRDGCSR